MTCGVLPPGPTLIAAGAYGLPCERPVGSGGRSPGSASGGSDLVEACCEDREGHFFGTRLSPAAPVGDGRSGRWAIARGRGPRSGRSVAGRRDHIGQRNPAADGRGSCRTRRSSRSGSSQSQSAAGTRSGAAGGTGGRLRCRPRRWRATYDGTGQSATAACGGEDGGLSRGRLSRAVSGAACAGSPRR